jgi:beta-glucanase (GH16 family)
MKRNIFLLLVSAVSVCTFAQNESDSPENAYPGYKLVFHDEFNVDGKPDANYWRFEKGYVRNNEAQYYQEDNTWCEGGNLIIEGRKNDNGHSYTSSSMVSRGKTEGNYISAWMYGRFEVKAKIPAYTGCWPAIWLLGTEGEWPYNGEVDMMEYYPSGSTELLHANVAWGSSKRWCPIWNSKTKKLSDLEAKDPDWRNKFHVWRMDWDEDYIKLYVDGELLNTTSLSKTINPYTDWFQYENDNPYRDHYMYILLNLALGGNNGGSLSKTPFPCRYEIDYVRVYQVDDNVTKINNVGLTASDNSYYTLGGSKVSQPDRNGIYIHNGRKVVVK